MATRIAAPQNPREKLDAKIRTALQNNADFLAITNPTNAQTLAQVKALTRQMNNVIRLVAGVLDGSSD